MAEFKRYVDPDAVDANGNGKSAALSADGNGDYAFKSIIDAEAAGGAEGQCPLNLTTNHDTLVIECCSSSGTHSEDAPVSGTGYIISGYITGTNGTDGITIQAATASQAGPVWDTSKYRLSVADANAYTIYCGANTSNSLVSVRTVGLQIRIASATAARDVFYISGNGAANPNYGYIIFDSCLFRHESTSSTYNCRIIFATIYGTVYFLNCFGVTRGTRNNSANNAFVGGTSCIFYHYSCTYFCRGYSGIISGTTFNAYCKNTYVGGTINSDFRQPSGALYLDYCASEDLTADDFTGANNITGVALSTANFNNVTGGSENCTLVSDGTDPLFNAGYNTSGETAPLGGWSDDIAGQNRGTAWDIGCWEYNTSSATTFIYGVMQHKHIPAFMGA